MDSYDGWGKDWGNETCQARDGGSCDLKKLRGYGTVRKRSRVWYSSSVPEVSPDCADETTVDESEAPTQRMAKPTNKIVHDISDPRREGAILTSCHLPLDPCESNI